MTASRPEMNGPGAVPGPFRILEQGQNANIAAKRRAANDKGQAP